MSLIQTLLENNIIKIRSPEEEPFLLKSGKKSRFFIDIKQAILDPDYLREIVELIDSIGQKEEWYFDRIASVVIGGIPIATALCLIWDERQIIIRSEKHNRGMKQKIIGDCKGLRCLLIEDVSTTGGSIVEAVQSIREEGGICEDVIVVVDREEGARELCEQNNIHLHACLTKSDLGIEE